jgi:Nucleoside transporter
MLFKLIISQNVSGTFTAIVSIISLTVAPNARTAAIYYFITALFILLACFDTYFALPLNVRFLVQKKNYNIWLMNYCCFSEVLSVPRAVEPEGAAGEAEGQCWSANLSTVVARLQTVSAAAFQRVFHVLHHPLHLPGSAFGYIFDPT